MDLQDEESARRSVKKRKKKEKKKKKCSISFSFSLPGMSTSVAPMITIFILCTSIWRVQFVPILSRDCMPAFALILMRRHGWCKCLEGFEKERKRKSAV